MVKSLFLHQLQTNVCLRIEPSCALLMSESCTCRNWNGTLPLNTVKCTYGDVGRVCFSLVQVLNLQHHCLRFQRSGSERWGVERPLSHTELLLWVSTLSTWAALLWGRTSLGLVHALNSFVHSTAVDSVSRATSQPSYLTGLLKERTQAITTAAIFWSRTRGAGNSSV